MEAWTQGDGEEGGRTSTVTPHFPLPNCIVVPNRRTDHQLLCNTILLAIAPSVLPLHIPTFTKANNMFAETLYQYEGNYLLPR